MGVRDAIQKNSKIGAIAAGALLVIATIVIIAEARSMRSESGDTGTYYTSDDGKTYFTDSIAKITPYESGGKTVVKAHVFNVKGTPTVVYLSRYSKASLDALNEALRARAANRPPAHPEVLARMSTSGTEVKRPGDTKWYTINDPEYAKITRSMAGQDELSP